MMAKVSQEEQTEVLEKTLEKVGNEGWWVWCVFFMASTPGLFNAAHIMSYVFLSHTPTHWCQIDELVATNWTNQQIISVSTIGGNSSTSFCSYYDWNYTYLAQLEYQEALKYTSQSPKPKLIPCKKYDYDETVPKSSIVSEWDLVCENAALRSNAQVSIAIGKFVGGFIFGFIADKFGRKRSFVLSCLLYIVSGPAAGFTQSFLVFTIARFFIGIAGSGVYESAYTILTEIAVKKRRTIFGCTFNMSYPVGYITLAIIAFYFQSWRSLQYAISIPTLFLLIHCWFIPESPRWLLAQGRRADAWQVIQGVEKSLIPDDFFHNSKIGVEGSNKSKSWFKRLMLSMGKLLSIFNNKELCSRIIICYITWFGAALSYYAIALNADNFTANRYMYVALNGLTEAPSYILPLLLLTFLGRKSAASLLFLVCGSALISILSLSPEDKDVIVIVAMLGRFCISAVFAVIILHTSELFPTSNRNTAIGTSLTMSQLGSIGAPYIVDVLGAYGWYIPSTICGCLSLLSGLLILLLPETKDKPLFDNIEDLKETHHNDRVSIKNCCFFS
uniref:Major facilitator superfamily (MFS) profile domain-containing protein n=2 Tax=Clastoptera arizonana TaxID=38151 RepID=A0A1B6E2F2_9HEMI